MFTYTLNIKFFETHFILLIDKTRVIHAKPIIYQCINRVCERQQMILFYYPNFEIFLLVTEMWNVNYFCISLPNLNLVGCNSSETHKERDRVTLWNQYCYGVVDTIKASETYKSYKLNFAVWTNPCLSLHV